MSVVLGALLPVSLSDLRPEVQEALDELQGDMYIRQPETIVLLSEHGPMIDDNIVVNVSAGHTDTQLAAQLVSSFARGIDEKELPYEVQDALEFVISRNRNTRIVHCTVPNISEEQREIYAERMRGVLQQSRKRIALVVVGNLSRSGNRGYDHIVMGLLRSGDLDRIRRIEPSIAEAAETNLRNVLPLFFSILRDTAFRVPILEHCDSTAATSSCVVEVTM